MPITSTNTNTNTHHIMKVLHIVLNTNTMSAPSNSTNFGYLVLAISPVKYVSMVNLGMGSTTSNVIIFPTISRVYWELQMDKHIYDVYHVTEKALKLQLIIVMEDIFYNKLHINNIIYISMTTKELIDHMWAIYGEVMTINLSQTQYK